MTLPGGGIVPGPEVEHANAAGVSPAGARRGSRESPVGEGHGVGSMRSVRSFAFASRDRSWRAGSTSAPPDARTEVWSNTVWLT